MLISCGYKQEYKVKLPDPSFIIDLQKECNEPIDDRYLIIKEYNNSKHYGYYNYDVYAYITCGNKTLKSPVLEFGTTDKKYFDEEE